MYANAPSEPAARTAALLETEQIARRYPDTARARSLVLPEAERLLSLGQVERARIHLEAAKLVGVESSDLEARVESALDSRLPNRKEALATRRTIDHEYTKASHDLIRQRYDVSEAVNDRAAMARASIGAKTLKQHIDGSGSQAGLIGEPAG